MARWLGAPRFPGGRKGNKHIIALQEAMSEGGAAWDELFADLAERGLRAPELLIADGANGLWAANPIESIFLPIRKRTDAMKRLRTDESGEIERPFGRGLLFTCGGGNFRERRVSKARERYELFLRIIAWEDLGERCNQ